MYKGDVPTEDVHESSGKEPTAPSAPPASSMDRIAGYERVNFKGGKPAVLYSSCKII